MSSPHRDVSRDTTTAPAHGVLRSVTGWYLTALSPDAVSEHQQKARATLDAAEEAGAIDGPGHPEFDLAIARIIDRGDGVSALDALQRVTDRLHRRRALRRHNPAQVNRLDVLESAVLTRWMDQHWVETDPLWCPVHDYIDTHGLRTHDFINARRDHIRRDVSHLGADRLASLTVFTSPWFKATVASAIREYPDTILAWCTDHPKGILALLGQRALPYHVRDFAANRAIAHLLRLMEREDDVGADYYRALSNVFAFVMASRSALARETTGALATVLRNADRDRFADVRSTLLKSRHLSASEIAEMIPIDFGPVAAGHAEPPAHLLNESVTHTYAWAPALTLEHVHHILRATKTWGADGLAAEGLASRDEFLADPAVRERLTMSRNGGVMRRLMASETNDAAQWEHFLRLAKAAPRQAVEVWEAGALRVPPGRAGDLEALCTHRYARLRQAALQMLGTLDDTEG